MAERETYCADTFHLGILGICVSIRRHSTSLHVLIVISFYFPGMLVGPYLEFADYMNLIEGTVFKSLLKDDEKAGKLSARQLIPKGRKRVAYRRGLLGLVLLGVFVVFGGTHTYAAAVTEKFRKMDLIQRQVSLTRV